MNKDIVLTTINAKWIHPSLALRLLKANLGSLETSCEIIEFALRQPLREKVEGLAGKDMRILGISVSIWNHTATLELLGELEKLWAASGKKPLVVLGGPEVSHLPNDAEIFKYADHVVRGEGEVAFRELCVGVMSGTEGIVSGYHLYSDEDLARKLVYVESSRGCPFACEFCLSAVGAEQPADRVRKFPLEPFIAEMDTLVRRGAKTFKFLDRTFNSDIPRALAIMEFFLDKIKEYKDIVVHFEMVPSIFPQNLRDILCLFPPGSLRLEVGIQTLNPKTAALINRPSFPQKELETLRFLREKTNAIIHADLIAGLPGEDLESFGRGFDQLWGVLQSGADNVEIQQVEIQLGILKLLPGAPILRHSQEFAMRYNPNPPYEIEETRDISAENLLRIKNFARFWELIVNRYNFPNGALSSDRVFDNFMLLSDRLYSHFGRNWGIAKNELQSVVCP